MAEDWEDFVSHGHGPNFDRSSAATADILRQLDLSQPRAVIYSRILYTILDAMTKAQSELADEDWRSDED